MQFYNALSNVRRLAEYRLNSKQEEFLKLNSLHDSVTADLRLAANFQEQLLPSAKRYGEYETRGLSKPAMFVAGDIYDVFRITESVMAFYMADVTGHGPAAAMISYSIHKLLNPKSSGLCVQKYLSSQRLSEAVVNTVVGVNNEYAGLKGDAHYFTLVYGLLNFSTGEICFVQAGHPAPMYFSKNTEKVSEIGEGGVPVGMLEGMEYQCYQCELNHGDSFYVYSDGITECFSPANEEYGRDRLCDVIATVNNRDLTEVLQSIDESITSWKGNSVFSDDVSILGIKRH